MKVHNLDDWFDTLRRLPSFDRLKDHHVTIWNDHAKERQALFCDIYNQITAYSDGAPIHMINPKVREGR